MAMKSDNFPLAMMSGTAVPFILCHKCQKRVDETLIEFSHYKQVYRIRVRCHGEQEIREITLFDVHEFGINEDTPGVAFDQTQNSLPQVQQDDPGP